MSKSPLEVLNTIHLKAIQQNPTARLLSQYVDEEMKVAERMAALEAMDGGRQLTLDMLGRAQAAGGAKGVRRFDEIYGRLHTEGSSDVSGGLTVFDRARRTNSILPTSAPAAISGPPPEPRRVTFVTQVAPPRISAFGAQARHDRRVAEAAAADDQRFAQARAEWALAIEEWHTVARQADEERRSSEARVQQQQTEIDRHNTSVDEWQAAVEQGDADAITLYFSTVLHDLRIAHLNWNRREVTAEYVSDRRQLLLEVVPPVHGSMQPIGGFEYVGTDAQAKRICKPVPKTPEAAVDLYDVMLPSLVLRIIHTLFEADAWGLLESVVVNGTTSATDPRTGNVADIVVSSAAVTCNQFHDLNFARLDPSACLAALGARMSPKPGSFVGVEPIARPKVPTTARMRSLLVGVPSISSEDIKMSVFAGMMNEGLMSMVKVR